MNLNHIIISCRLTKDGESRDYNGKRIFTFGLVHNDSKKVNGEWKSEELVKWIADNCEEGLK